MIEDPLAGVSVTATYADALECMNKLRMCSVKALMNSDDMVTLAVAVTLVMDIAAELIAFCYGKTGREVMSDFNERFKEAKR